MNPRLVGAIVVSVLITVGTAAHAQVIQAFSLDRLDGERFDVGQILGQKPIILTFWATWCVPCRIEHPHLQKLYEKYREDGLEVVAVSVDEAGNTAKVRAHANRLGLKFVILLDPDSRISRIYNSAKTFPMTYLIAADGTVRATYSGFSPGDEVKLEADLRAALGKQ